MKIPFYRKPKETSGRKRGRCLLGIALNRRSYRASLGNGHNRKTKIAEHQQPNPVCTIIARIFAVALVVFGIWSSFDRDMFSKLFLGFSFDYWPEERPAVLFLAEKLSIMGVYIFAGYYALEILKRRQVDFR